MKTKLIQTDSYYLLVNTEADVKEGDTILCDERNHISELPKYVIKTCKSIENSWIMTNEEDGQGENPDWTSKIIAHLPKGNAHKLEGIDLLQLNLFK
jgi:hypothetical protein